ncbi:hypothetical protein GGR53DRAFT_462812 [Hypoxylon sp. FL1150]|nr:hypothetical protein GGR53DRAFT_462812 [Hypoxylon sp. FL1150]
MSSVAAEGLGGSDGISNRLSTVGESCQLAPLDVIRLFDTNAAELVDDEEQKDYLACPFWKHNPSRYKHVKNVCTMGKGFKDLGKLTEHIRRVHCLRFGCEKCKTRFTKSRVDEVEEEKHKHMAKCTKSKELTDSDPEWMDETQDEEYGRLNFKRDKSNSLRCYSKICRALWGDSENAIAGPYHTPGFQLAVLRWRFFSDLEQLLGQRNPVIFQQRQEAAAVAGATPTPFNQHVDPTLLSQLNQLGGNEPFYRGQHRKDSGVYSWDHTSDNQPNYIKLPLLPTDFSFDRGSARDSPGLAQTESNFAGAWMGPDGISPSHLDMDVDNEEDIDALTERAMA